MKKPTWIAALVVVLFTVTAVVGCGDSSTPAAVGSAGVATSGGVGTGSTSLPAADDLPETGLQGEVPLADQLSGRSALGYRKGVKLVGRNAIMNRGANFSLAWLDDCAYVTTTSPGQLFGTTSPSATPIDTANPLNGMAVIDAADPTAPKLIDILQSPAMLSAHESLHANQARKIIVATQSMGTKFDVYDARDCRHPVLKATIDLGQGLTALGFNRGLEFSGHALCLSDDGLTAFATTTAFAVPNAAIDLTDLAHPKVITTVSPGAHDCTVSRDGNRLYLVPFNFGAVSTPNGLYILDSSAIQRRAANLQTPTVGVLAWTAQSEQEAPNAGSHTARVFRNGSRSYVYSNDEWPVDTPCPWAHARIIDITDETHPVKVSDLTLEVQQLANCATSQVDSANYSTHYVGFDDDDRPTTAFSTNYAGGLRVWNIRDPAKPFEIAYYHPVPNPDSALVSSGQQTALANGSLWDTVGNYVRYRPETGQIWIVGYTSGFQILQLTDSAGPTAPRPTSR